eukprot:scaffold219698_cov49-Prasinocladus_malaysianus.AAC.2
MTASHSQRDQSRPDTPGAPHPETYIPVALSVVPLALTVAIVKKHRCQTHLLSESLVHDVVLAHTERVGHNIDHVGAAPYDVLQLVQTAAFDGHANSLIELAIRNASASGITRLKFELMQTNFYREWLHVYLASVGYLSIIRSTICSKRAS